MRKSSYCERYDAPETCASWGRPEVYGELLSTAEAWVRQDRYPDALDPEALVHETWLRLARQTLPALEGTSHLVALATREMQRVRIDHVRAARAAKRGGARHRVELSDEVALEAVPVDEELAGLLERIAEHSPRWGRIVDLRWACGWTVARVARELDVSVGTIEKDSARVRAWLARELQRVA